MINALKGLGHNQFERARWASESYETYKLIPVEVVSDNEKRWNTAIRNLMATADSMLIRTSYVYDYAPGQHIYFRDKWWEIRAVTEVTQDVASQALSLVKGGNRQSVIEIAKVNGYNT